jgi:hypothetical protein
MDHYKTAPNTNVYLEEEVNGAIPASPRPQALRWVSNDLEGSYETIENDTKLPGRNPMCVYLGIGCSGRNKAGTLCRLESAQAKGSRWNV